MWYDDPDDPLTKLYIRAFCELLLDHESMHDELVVLANILNARIQEISGKENRTRQSMDFLRHFMKNTHCPEYREKLPKRVYKLYRSTRVTTNRNKEFAFTKPTSFILDGKPYRVVPNTWKNLLIKLCGLIAKQNTGWEHLFLLISGHNGRYFKRGQRDGLHDAKLIPGTDIFVETNLKAPNIVSLCQMICEQFGYSSIEVVTLQDQLNSWIKQ